MLKLIYVRFYILRAVFQCNWFISDLYMAILMPLKSENCLFAILKDKAKKPFKVHTQEEVVISDQTLKSFS